MDSISSESAASVELIAHDGAVLTAKFFYDGRLFFTGGEDGFIRFWDPWGHSLVTQFTGHDGQVRDVCVSGDNTKMSSCGGDGRVFYWDLCTERPISVFGCHNGEVNAVKFNEFASVIVSADSSSVRVWDTKSDTIEPIQIFTFDKSVSSLCLRRTEIIAGSIDGSVQKFDLRSNKRVSYNMGSPVKCMNLATSDDTYALASGLGSSLQLLSIEPSNVITVGTYTGHTCKSHKVGCCFTNTGSHAIGGSEDGEIFIWNVLSRCVVKQFPAHSSVVTCVDYHPVEDCLISASADGSVALWKA